MSSDESNDFFDDDVDLDEVLSNANKIRSTQQINQTQQHLTPNQPQYQGIQNQDLLPRTSLAQKRIQANDVITQTTIQPRNTSSSTQQQQTPLDLRTLQGENAILRSQLKELSRKQTEEQRRMKDKFEHLLHEKEQRIESLNDSISKAKEDYYFLETDNRNMNNRYHQNKKRKIHDDTSSGAYETSNTSIDISANEMKTNTTTVTVTPQKADVPAEPVKPLPITKTKVAIMSQATIYQDEKNLFLENINVHLIPGASLTTLQFLSSINSSFDFSHKNFIILKDQESFKTSIINYLIKFEKRNRIDLLIYDFIDILLTYIIKVLDSESVDEQLLPIPFLLSLIHFTLNYKPKAVSDELLTYITDRICLILQQYPFILRQETIYVDTRGEISSDPQDEPNFDLIEKTMHVKILETIIVVHCVNILESLVNLATYLGTFNPDYRTHIWSIIPKELINNCLSIRTPIEFLISMVGNLINSVDKDKIFALNNANQRGPTGKLSIGLHDLLQKLITLIDTTDWSSSIALNIYGLNRTLGSNSHFKLLECLIPDSPSSFPVPQSFDLYRELTLTPAIQSNNKLKQEIQIVTLQYKILQLFEIYFTLNPNKSIRSETLNNFMNCIVSNLGVQQELILNSVRAPTVSLRLSCIKLIVKLVHYLLESSEYDININQLNSFTLREMIISLLRISADNIKSLSAELLMKLRLQDHFKFPVFNDSSSSELISNTPNFDYTYKSSELNDDSQNSNEFVDIEIGLSNGIEINYDDETIDLARDVIAQCITGDEADALHYSINYDIPHDSDVEMIY